ncbi:TPA: hypothetical protein DDW35_13560 [Candidatus Sumerlaeota bacterium]|jgi:uncharacterized metal-binding protein YceD (DUF177 family)|nr:hypothetical protein [Candidatus Sumerlaeota bacterium]
MRIELSQLREGPVPYDIEFSPDFLDGEEGDGVRFDAATGSVTFALVGDEISAKGELRTVVHALCGRCLTAVSMPLVVPVHLYFWHRAKFESWSSGLEEGEVDPNAPDVNVYSGESFDPDEDLRELVLLEAPTVFLCSEKCKGLCPSCGADLNKETCSCPKGEDADDPMMPAWKRNLKKIHLQD